MIQLCQRRTMAACLATIASLACSGNPRHAEASPDDREQIRQLHERDAKAVLASDTSTLMSLWTDDIVSIFAGQGIRVGRTANAERMRESMAASQDMEPLAYRLDVDTVEIIGDHAIEWGRFSGSSRHRVTGVTTSFHGPMLRILRRERGQWRVARTMFAVEPAS